jgi:hypothetical protein
VPLPNIDALGVAALLIILLLKFIQFRVSHFCLERIAFFVHILEGDTVKISKDLDQSTFLSVNDSSDGPNCFAEGCEYPESCRLGRDAAYRFHSAG